MIGFNASGTLITGGFVSSTKTGSGSGIISAFGGS